MRLHKFSYQDPDYCFDMGPGTPAPMPEAKRRQLIRDTLAATVRYAPRYFDLMARHVRREVMRLREQHTASIRRERLHGGTDS